MSRSYWKTEKWVSDAWVEEDTGIYAPNQDLNIMKKSTQETLMLANGKQAFITPSNKKLYDPIIFTWYYENGTMKDKIKAYISNQDDLKITDDNGDEYIGRFTFVEFTRYVGKVNRYDTQANFTIMEGLHE